MPDYSKGVIYTIRCLNDPNVYVGSTIQSLSVRMGGHRKAYVKNKVLGLNKEIVKNIDDWKIELYELCPCLTRQELHRREGEVIREIGTLNKCIAGRTKNEYYIDNINKIKEYGKEYYIDNKDKIAEKDKKYRQANKEKRVEYNKIYNEVNKDKISERRKIYCETNKVKIAEKKKIRRDVNIDEINKNRREYYELKKNEINQKRRVYQAKKREQNKQIV